MITTRKEELMPLYDFCNVIPQELLDEKDIDNLPKFKVEISPNHLICIVKNKNAESIYLILHSKVMESFLSMMKNRRLFIIL